MVACALERVVLLLSYVPLRDLHPYGHLTATHVAAPSTCGPVVEEVAALAPTLARPWPSALTHGSAADPLPCLLLRACEVRPSATANPTW